MTDIDQNMVFQRLPLTAQQRKKLYEAITGAEPQRDSAIPVDNSESPDSLVRLDPCPDPLADSHGSQTHRPL